MTTPFAPVTSISYRTGTFHYPMTFSAYILCFCAQFSFDLVTLTFDLLTFSGVWRIKSSICLTHLPILSFLRLSVPELCVTRSDHTTITSNGHCACAVSRDLSRGEGAKIIQIFEISDPNLPIHLSLSGSYDEV